MSLVSARQLFVERQGQTWIAGDVVVMEEHFLAGLIGIQRTQGRLQFNYDEWSWRKGDLHVDDVADPEAVVPFAIDLREDRRWVAFSPKGRINYGTFPKGFKILLGAALARQREVFVNWDVDPVASGVLLRQWVEDHPNVKELRVTLRLDNPGIDYDGDRELMRSLNSPNGDRIFHAPRGERLTIENELDALESGMVQTNTTIRMRAQENGRPVRYFSEMSPETDWIDDFGDDVGVGIDLVVEALRRFSDSHLPPTMTGDPSDEPTDQGGQAGTDE